MLVNTKGDIKLCDFGVSRQLCLSIAKTYVGTNAYMAPERIRGNEYRIASDVWSLGVSVAEMALGRNPFESSDENSAKKPLNFLKAVTDFELPLPSTILESNFSFFLADFIKICLNRDAEKRPKPQDLLVHPFVQPCLHSDRSIFAKWVIRRTELNATSSSAQ